MPNSFDDEVVRFNALQTAVESKYRTVADLTTTRRTFRTAFVRQRRELDRRISRVTELALPLTDLAGGYRKLRTGVDQLIIGAWHRGVRERRGYVEVKEVPKRKVWSKTSVKNACDILGLSYEEFEVAAGLAAGTVPTVKVW